jgi:hypothetical protein
VAILAVLYEEIKDDTTVAKAEVDQAAEEILARYGDWIDELWEDCTSEMQAGLVDLFQGDRPSIEFSGERGRELDARGFISIQGGKAVSSCRLLRRHASKYATEVADIHRLFGTAERFRENSRRLLEARLMQVQSVDADLFNAVSRAIREIREPIHCITTARIISETALELVWKKELTNPPNLPAEWIAALRKVRKVSDRTPDIDQVPDELGVQCWLLRMLTGVKGLPRQTRYVSKPTFTLINHIQAVGDLGAHKKGEPITWSYAVSFCFAAAELLDSMHRDFSS